MFHIPPRKLVHIPPRSTEVELLASFIGPVISVTTLCSKTIAPLDTISTLSGPLVLRFGPPWIIPVEAEAFQGVEKQYVHANPCSQTHVDQKTWREAPKNLETAKD
jgi:hypothetical protein